MTVYWEREGLTLWNAPALDVARSLPDDSVDLIICDWPYFRVKSDDWDNQWPTAAAFLDWMAEHLAEYRRILAPNGSYYGFASPQMAARVEVLTGEWFNVLNHITWSKNVGWSKRQTKEEMRAYFPTSERIIFAEHYNADNAAKGEAGYVLQCDKLRGFVFEPLRAYLASEWKRAGFKFEQANEACGTASMAGRHFFSRSQWCLPTKEHYASLQRYANRNQPGEHLRREYEDLRREYEYLRREYEDLRREYEDLRRPFNAHKDTPYTDVWTFPTVAAYKGKHPCQKPDAMFRHIIEMSSKPRGVVFDPMCGAGGSAYAARSLGRVWIGGDTDPRWCNATVKRLARNMDDWQPVAIEQENAKLGPLFAL